MSETQSVDEAVDQPADDASFEQNLAELEQIVEQLEAGDLELAESMERFKRGVELSKRCRGLLDQAQQTIDEMTASDDAAPAPEEPSETSD